MIMANLDAQLEQIEKDIADVESDITRLNKIIANTTEIRNNLIQRLQDLRYEKTEVEDEMEDLRNE